MEQKEIIEMHGVLTIRPARPSELKEAAKLLKASFPVHNIFQGTPKEACGYLAKIRKSEAKNPLGFGVIVAMLKEGRKDILAGAMVVSQKTFSKKQLHAAFKYSHIAVNEKYRKHSIGSKMIGYADAKIRELIGKGRLKTARVQANISENEKETMLFYEKNGFRTESTLNHYYRHNEPVYILSKLIEAQNQAKSG